MNEKLLQQKEYSDIVFSKFTNAGEGSSIRGMMCSYVTGMLVKTLLCGGIVIALNVIVMKDVVIMAQPTLFKNAAYILIIIAFVLAVINYIISALYRRALWRIISCLNRPGEPVIITQIIRYLIIFALTFAYSLLLKFEYGNMQYMILFYRAFNRLFHAPYAASLESAVLFILMKATEN